VGTGPPHGDPQDPASADLPRTDRDQPAEHDWWTPEHPEDGLSWEDPGATARRAGSRRARLRNGPRAGGRAVRRHGRALRARGAAIRRRRLALAGAAAVVIVVVVIVLIAGGGGPSVVGPPLPGLGHPASSGDPFAYSPSDEAAFAQRAAIGNAQVLFTLSPGGAIATAKRVAAFIPLIDAAVKGTSIPPTTLEAMIFLESAGRSEVIAGNDPADASGLTQILAATGQSLLGMHINLAASRRITAQLSNATNPATIARLQARRAAVDARFVPAKALAATVRYLQIAQRQFGRLDLAVESYHMGIGNLQQVLSDFDGGKAVPYAQVFFSASPVRDPRRGRARVHPGA
jgi:hypothetical protein